MNPQDKGILINAIINYIGGEVKAKNKKLASENLHHKQEAFDAGEWFIKLAFMEDKAIKEIAGKILQWPQANKQKRQA